MILSGFVEAEGKDDEKEAAVVEEAGALNGEGDGVPLGFTDTYGELSTSNLEGLRCRLPDTGTIY